MELNKLVDKQKIEDFIAEKKTTMDATFLNDDGSQYEQKETKDKQFKITNLNLSSGGHEKVDPIIPKQQVKAIASDLEVILTLS